jgi:hypothetical protein
MSWFSKHFGIRLDSHTLGNLLKNVSPAAGLIGGPVGIALAGGLSTLGDLERGRNIGQALKGSVGNAALGAGVGSLASHGFLGGGLQSFSGGSPAASAAGSVAPSAASDAASAAANAPSAAAGLPSFAADGAFAPPPVTGALTLASPASEVTSGAGGGLLKGAGSFIAHNPTAASLGLQGLGHLATSGSANAAARAQARLYGTEADAADYALHRQEGQDKALDPFRASLLGTIGQRLTQPVSRNPYMPPTPAGG